MTITSEELTKALFMLLIFAASILLITNLSFLTVTEKFVGGATSLILFLVYFFKLMDVF